MRGRNQIKTTEPTRYEVALVRGSDKLYSYGCTARKSKQGILDMATVNVEHLLTAEEIEESDSTDLTYSRKYGFKLANDLYIRFTGETERSLANNA